MATEEASKVEAASVTHKIKSEAPSKNAKDAKQQNNSSTTVKQPAPIKKQGGSFAIGLALVACLALIGASYYGYEQLLWVRQQLALQAQQTDLVQQARLIEQQQYNQTILQQQFESLEQQFIQIQQPTEQLNQLSELDYLLNLAQLRLDLESNLPAAVEILRLANSKLATFKLLASTELTQQLAANLHELTEFEYLSPAHLASELQGLAAQALSLKVVSLAGAQGLSFDTAEAESSIEETATWYTSLWQEMQGLIVVRKHELPIRALPFADEEQALRYQLNNLLLQAAWASLHGEQELYNSSLNAALERLASFDANQEQVSSFHTQLEELSGRQIKQQLPSLNQSIVSLQEYKAKLSQQMQQGSASEEVLEESPAATVKEI